jgi:predicted RNA-binding Zn-ribbon protein involved in translation (DUF1610 family)
MTDRDDAVATCPACDADTSSRSAPFICPSCGKFVPEVSGL